jgi:flagellar basal-body rod protein FlgB
MNLVRGRPDGYAWRAMMDKNFMVLERILEATVRRHKVLASNIANADTPGYKAKDIKFGDILKDQMGMARTSPRHLKGRIGGAGGRIVLDESLSWGDRNNVELNREVAKMTENQLLHDAAIKILNARIRMFKSAISSNGR